MNHWIVGILLWCLASIVAIVSSAVDLCVHYGRKYGPELTLMALNEVLDNWEQSLAFALVNVILWPYRVPAFIILVNRDLKDWFEANAQLKKVE